MDQSPSAAPGLGAPVRDGSVTFGRKHFSCPCLRLHKDRLSLLSSYVPGIVTSPSLVSPQRLPTASWAARSPTPTTVPMGWVPAASWGPLRSLFPNRSVAQMPSWGRNSEKYIPLRLPSLSFPHRGSTRVCVPSAVHPIGSHLAQTGHRQGQEAHCLLR